MAKPRKGRGGRMRSPEPPDRLADELERAYLAIARETWKVLRSTVLPAMAREQRDRTDDLSSVIRGALAIAKRRLLSAVSDASLERAASQAYKGTDAVHKREFYRRLAKAVGTDVLATEGFTAKVTRAWVGETTKRIKSVRGEVIPALARDIDDAFRTGLRHEELAKRWREQGLPVEFGTVEGRAKVIARDQIGTLNARLTQERQENLGIEKYTWRTSGDERVRPEHAARDGKTFPWSEPPSDGHPGEPVQCRCTAEAFIDLEALSNQSNVQLADPPDLEPALAAAAGGR